MTPAHKKHPISAHAPADTGKSEAAKTEPVVVSDVITETIEVIKDVPASQASASDPLTDFKEKMVKEELLAPDNAPKKNYMWPILLVFILAILLLVGVFLYKNQADTGNKVNVVTLSPTPTVAPQPTKTVDLAQYEIEIQNGSGVSGEAARQEENLKAEGFTISSIGNADNSDYTQTIIQAKEEVDEDFIAKLKEVLSSSFTVGETETLPDDSSVPVVVILGTKK